MEVTAADGLRSTTRDSVFFSFQAVTWVDKISMTTNPRDHPDNPDLPTAPPSCSPSSDVTDQKLKSQVITVSLPQVPQRQPLRSVSGSTWDWPRVAGAERASRTSASVMIYSLVLHTSMLCFGLSSVPTSLDGLPAKLPAHKCAPSCRLCSGA